MRRGPCRRKRLQLWHEFAGLVEEFLGLVTAQPVFDDLQVRWIRLRIQHRNLVRAPEVLDLVAIHLLRSGPSLGRSQHDHRPAWTLCFATAAGSLLDGTNLLDAAFHGRRHLLVHLLRIAALDEIGRVTVTT